MSGVAISPTRAPRPSSSRNITTAGRRAKPYDRRREKTKAPRKRISRKGREGGEGLEVASWLCGDRRDHRVYRVLGLHVARSARGGAGDAQRARTHGNAAGCY